MNQPDSAAERGDSSLPQQDPLATRAQDSINAASDPQQTEFTEPENVSADELAPETETEPKSELDHEPPAPTVTETQQEVTLQRTVRYGRVIIGAAVLGVIVGAIISLVFPIAEDAEYTMGQIVGFMVLIGGAIGLGVGGVLALILGGVAKRQRGVGIAIQSNVQ